MARGHKAKLDVSPLARIPQNYQRLREQARMWEGATSQLLDLIGLKPGMSCLDVGSGPGEVMRLMAERVGPQGRVTGIEMDAILGKQALDELRKSDGATFELIAEDLLKLDTVLGGPFDLVFCRFVLMQMRDPVTALERMLAWTKPGGTVAAQEFDFGALAFEPPCPAMGEFNRLFEAVFRSSGRNLRAGRQLPVQFDVAGLGTPDGTHAAVHFLPLSQLAQMLIGVYDGLYAAGAELGLADPARAASFRIEMAQAGEDGRYFCLTPVLIGALKRLA
jgi:ubiquinone/menaquinone biosynthesis C-methylase UbiE